MIIILETLTDIYKPQSRPDTKPVLIKRNVKCKKTFETHSIELEQYIKPNGQLSKQWCNVKQGESYYRIAHTFDYVQKLMQPVYVIGYKRWEK